MAGTTKPNELRIVRVYEAPVKAVWEAWTDPAQAAKWWGPRGFTITTHSKDLRVGGTWVYTMHGPDGVDYPNQTTYFAVEPYKKLVYDHGATQDQPALFRVTVEFSESKGKTTMAMTMTTPTPEAMEHVRQVIKKASGNSTWDRLGEYLDKAATGKERFVINRTFQAPLESMFDLWTDPQHLARWLPPTGFTMDFIRADVRPGGTSFYVMKNEQVAMYGRVAYQTIRKPDLLVYTQQFCDAQENISRHPLAPVWPETMLTRVEFAAEGPDQTRITVTWEPYGAATAEEVAAFIKARSGMTHGWTGSFDKLEAALPAILGQS